MDRQAEESLALAPPFIVVIVIIIVIIIIITVGIITIVQRQAKTSSVPLPKHFMVNLSKTIEKSNPKLHQELRQQQGPPLPIDVEKENILILLRYILHLH